MMCMVGGGLFAHIATSLEASAYVHILNMLILASPIAVVECKKYRYKKQEKQEHTETNPLIKRVTKVCETINNAEDTGKVMVDGIEWRARSANPANVIREGSVIQILQVEGGEVIVTSLILKWK